MNLLFKRISSIMIVLALVMSPRMMTTPDAAAAQADAPDCTGIAEWYAAIGDLKRQVAAAENDPTVSFGTPNPGLYRQAVQQLGTIEAPSIIEEAQQALSNGYSALADFLDGGIAISQGMSAGQTPTYDAQSNNVSLLSDARGQLLGGFLAWTVAGVTCGITTAQFTPSPVRGCDGVADYLNTAAATIGGFWNFWYDTANQNKTDTSALPLGTGEILSGAAFEDALKLATTPAPEMAMEIQLATVQYLGALSNLYLLNLLGAMGVYYGLDQQGLNQIQEQHQQQLELTQQQDASIDQAWTELALDCDVATLYPKSGQPDPE
ncbi:MAG: hypothetical protein ACRDHN_01635 [Thermomicrobiales bacterium]